jgi:hypothetical protein
MIDLDRVTGPKPFVLAFVVAGVISAVLWASYVLLIDPIGTTRPPAHSGLVAWLLIGIGFSSLALFLLAVPLFVALTLLRIVNVWVTLLSGFAIGAVVACIVDWPNTRLGAFTHLEWTDVAVRQTCVFAAIGTVSAVGFWFTLRAFGLTPNNRWRGP